jgi:hypothetical protein
MIELTLEQQIAKHYSACLDSVALINSTKPELMTAEEWANCLARNKEHLKIQLGKNMFAGYDVTPLQQAAGE